MPRTGPFPPRHRIAKLLRVLVAGGGVLAAACAGEPGAGGEGAAAPDGGHPDAGTASAGPRDAPQPAAKKKAAPKEDDEAGGVRGW